MSRIGNRVLNIPEGVKVSVDGNTVTVSGPKGELKDTFNKNIKVSVEGNTIKVTRPDDSLTNKALHGTTNSLIENMLIGVSEGFVKNLEIYGVGYRCSVSGNKIELHLGFSHPVTVEAPDGVKVEAPSQTTLKISGIDKQKVNQFAAVVRNIKKPEPYKGKGIRYADEIVKLKEGKKASK